MKKILLNIGRSMALLLCAALLCISINIAYVPAEEEGIEAFSSDTKDFVQTIESSDADDYELTYYDAEGEDADDEKSPEITVKSSEDESETMAEVVSELASEAGEKAVSDAGSEAGEKAVSDAASEAGEKAVSDAASEVVADAVSEDESAEAELIGEVITKESDYIQADKARVKLLYNELLLLLDKNSSVEDLVAFIQGIGDEDAAELYFELSEDVLSQIWLLFGLKGFSSEQEIQEIISNVRELFGVQDMVLMAKIQGDALVGTDPMTWGNDYGGGRFGDYMLPDPWTGANSWVASDTYGVYTAQGKYSAFCVEVTSVGPKGQQSTAKKVENDVKTMIYLVSPCGPLYGKYDFGKRLSNTYADGFDSYMSTTTRNRVLAHCMLSGLYCGNWGPWYEYTINQMKLAVEDIKTLFKVDAECKAWFDNSESYYMSFGTDSLGLDIQDIYWVVASNKPELGSFSLSKKSACLGISEGNPYYTLEGAVYGVYTDKECSTLYCRAVTDAAGSFELDKLPYGTYYVKELSPSGGFSLAVCAVSDEAVHTVTIDSKNPKGSITCIEPLQAAVIDLLLQKKDRDSDGFKPLGEASFEGAEYTLCYYTNDTWTGKPQKTWVFVTDEDGKIYFSDKYLKEGSDPLYKTDDGIAVIPKGSFTVSETKAPEGYCIDDTVYKYQVNGEATGKSKASIAQILLTPKLDPGTGIISSEPVSRGNFTFTKTVGGRRGLANALFKVTAVATGETHYIVTDEKGVYNGQKYEKNNKNDLAVSFDEDGNIVVDESLLSCENNVWFGQTDNGSISEANANAASFPYGTYTFTEIMTSVSPKGCPMIEFSGTIYQDQLYLNSEFLYDLGTKENSPEGAPSIYTSACDAVDKDKHVDASCEDIEIIDTVSYENLLQKEVYKLVGCIWDITNQDYYRDSKGEILKLEQELTAEADKGSVQMKFILSGTILREKKTEKIVVFEELYDQDGELLDQHTQISNEDQSIYIDQPEEPETTTPEPETTTFEETTTTPEAETTTTPEPTTSPEPETTTPQTPLTPKTSDSNNLLPIMILALLALSALSSGILLKIKR